MAAHLGEVDEGKIDNMAYIWFELILQALGKRLDFESVINLLGNSFAKDAAKAVAAANPLRKGKKSGGAGAAFAQMAGNIKIIDAKKGDVFGGSTSPLGDIAWIKDVKSKDTGKE